MKEQITFYSYFEEPDQTLPLQEVTDPVPTFPTDSALQYQVGHLM